MTSAPYSGGLNVRDFQYLGGGLDGNDWEDKRQELKTSRCAEDTT